MTGQLVLPMPRRKRIAFWILWHGMPTFARWFDPKYDQIWWQWGEPMFIGILPEREKP